MDKNQASVFYFKTNSSFFILKPSPVNLKRLVHYVAGVAEEEGVRGVRGIVGGDDGEVALHEFIFFVDMLGANVRVSE